MDEEYGDEMVLGAEDAATTVAPQEGPDEAERRLVAKLTDRIKQDRKHFEKDFKQMREDMEIARRGAPVKEWPDGNYIANITGRHINQKVAALYAKNPKAIARRRERLDFSVWDESEQTLMMALQAVQMAQQAGAVDPMAAQMAMQDPMIQESMALVQDYQQGMMHREMVGKIGKTLELLFDYFTKEQSPVDFKTSMKQLVRRAATTSVGYVKLGFQREFDQDPQVTQRLADFQRQLQHIQTLTEEAQDEAEPDREVKERELQHAMASLQEQQYVLIREGLVFDFPDSTSVIPDKMTRQLMGFVGARWLTVQHLYTVDEVKDVFRVDLKRYARYSDDGTIREDADQPSLALEDDTSGDMVCLWEHFDRQTGTVYIIAHGHDAFLKPPSAPDIYVEDFWPVYALTFNEVEDPKHLFPPSDVRLMFDMQMEYNRSRQGLREHRQAARPRLAIPSGLIDDEGKTRLKKAEPFDVIELNIAAEQMKAGILTPIQIPGVDPNLYETGPLFTDIQLVVGAQEAQFGAVSSATATESSIAEGSRIASVDSNVDDLDAFLTRIARACGQVLLKEMSPEQVTRIAGPGSVWPQVSLEDIAEEMYLEIEAGSSGKPNRTQEIRNWQEMLPFLVQMPNINPTWLARETLRRLDDRMDLTEAITESIPAIVAQNRMAGAAPPPGAAPEDQGGAGADNTQAPSQPGGGDVPLGNNQNRIM